MDAIRISLLARAAAGRYFAQAWSGIRKREAALVLLLLALTALLALLPTGFEKESKAQRVQARILSTDDSGVRSYGPILQGEQSATAVVQSGPFRGKALSGTNFLFGKLDQDKLFRPGDRALAVIDPDGSGGAASVTFQDHYRVHAEIALALVFIALLLAYGGWTGLRTLAAFGFTAVSVWKILVPSVLMGAEPVAASLLVVAALVIVITYAVAGFSRAGTAAVLGSLLGLSVCAAVGAAMAEPFKLNGAVRSFSETLLYAGFDHLSLRSLFLAGTYLACSGALIDLAIDVSVAMEEIKAEKPAIGFAALLRSGLSVGRKVFGTMTTTLLLAYSGSFLALFLVFTAQGVPMVTMFSLPYVSSEIFHTLIGSIGLVMVAPCTALTSAFLLSRERVPATAAEDGRADEPAVTES